VDLEGGKHDRLFQNKISPTFEDIAVNSIASRNMIATSTLQPCKRVVLKEDMVKRSRLHDDCLEPIELYIKSLGQTLGDSKRRVQELVHKITKVFLKIRFTS
jgi:hypothetical protein